MKKFNILSHRKFIIITNLFLILILMSVSIYAWFASNVDNRVDAYEVTVESDDALELSFDQSNWGGTLNLADYKVNGTSVLDSMKFVEVTSNGSTFKIPELTQHNGYATVNAGGTWKNAVANQDYLEFTVYLRSKDQMNVFLSSASKASPVSSMLTGPNCENPSTYASGADAFSKDCVVGALRATFLNNSNTRYIWITNPEFHLNNKIGSNEYSMEIGVDPASYGWGNLNSNEGTDFYWNKPDQHLYQSGENIYWVKSALASLPDTVSSVPAAGSSTHIASLTGTPDASGYYYDSVKFAFWLEGCDTEARRALVDGKFNISLVFDTFGI